MNDRNKNWDEYIDPRIDRLTKNKFFLEAFYLYSSVIEHILQKAIEFQEEWIVRLLKKSKIRFVKTKPKDLKEKTLGQLIAIFSRYCDDEEIISQLNNFNSFRIKLVHRLLDHSIEDLNKEAQRKQITYNELVSKLSRYNVMILEKEIRSNKRIIHKRFPLSKAI